MYCEANKGSFLRMWDQVISDTIHKETSVEVAAARERDWFIQIPPGA